jgi:hypothetical protein
MAAKKTVAKKPGTKRTAAKRALTPTTAPPLRGAA